jgi:iron complex transport system ATP-binding protein
MGFELEDISFFHGDHPVLEDISLTLSPGRFYGIVGPNGCGKTTLIDLLTRHRSAARGRIRYRGRPLEEFSRKHLARELALVPQNFYVNFPFTAAEIVMMGRYPHIPRFNAPAEADRRLVNDIMDKTDVRHLAGRWMTELSGGERQRVVFARALAQDTPVLLLDEATSNLDVSHALRLLNLAAEGVQRRGQLVVAVMQDINLAARYCDHLVFIKDGRVAADAGTARALTPETLRAVFDVEARVYADSFADSLQVVFRKGPSHCFAARKPQSGKEPFSRDETPCE